MDFIKVETATYIYFNIAIFAIVTLAKTYLPGHQTRTSDLSFRNLLLLYMHIFGCNTNIPFGNFC